MIKFNSLKAKITTLLTVTTLTIAFILFYIFITFYKKDKIAYIFESNAEILDTVGEQFRREVEFSSEIIKVHLENTRTNQKLALNAEMHLADDYFIDSIIVYRKKPNLTVVDQISKLNTPPNQKDAIRKLIEGQISNAEQTLHIDNDIVTVVSSYMKDDQAWALVYQYKSTTLADFFKPQGNVNTVLIDKNQGVNRFEYPGKRPVEADKINYELGTKITPLLNQNSVTKTIELGGVRYIFSSVRLYQSQAYLSSFLSEERVLANLQSLIVKSILFFILICAVVVLISYFSSDYLTHRLKKLTKSAEKIAAGQFDEKIVDDGHDEISTLTNGFNQMSIEISRLLNETADNARMESELKTAQLVQATLFPKDDYDSPFIRIKGCYTSASECGGDWWHYFEDQDKVWIWIADATGHGAGAALLTSAAKSAVSIIENLNLSLQESFEHLNFAICNVSKENMMMTSFVAVIDKKTLELSYINASHEPSILIKQSDSISKDDLIFLNAATNPRLGQSKDSKFTMSKITISPGDTIIFYTDGVMDIRNPASKTYGERSFMKGLVQSYNETNSLAEFFLAYERSLNTFRSSTELIDDVTYCFFEVKI